MQSRTRPGGLLTAALIEPLVRRKRPMGNSLGDDMMILLVQRVSLVGIAAAAFLAAVTAAYAAGPFTGLNGVWNGGGTIALQNGSRERIRCRATYAVGGDGTTLQQSLRCASDSYNFELRSDVRSEGEEIIGSWNEITRGVIGNLTG